VAITDEATAVDQEQEQEDEAPAFREIESMQEHGINMADILKLKQAGLATVLAVLMW
jgi:hypothetical protein